MPEVARRGAFSRPRHTPFQGRYSRLSSQSHSHAGCGLEFSPHNYRRADFRTHSSNADSESSMRSSARSEQAFSCSNSVPSETNSARTTLMSANLRGCALWATRTHYFRLDPILLQPAHQYGRSVWYFDRTSELKNSFHQDIFSRIWASPLQMPQSSN